MRIDPRYFRPSEVETLLDDPSKAHEKLGWTPITTLKELVAEMVAADKEAIAQWRSAGQTSHPEDWPVASGVPGEEAIKSWRDRSIGREVWLA